jgi:hypothetical protein
VAVLVEQIAGCAVTWLEGTVFGQLGVLSL